MSDDCILIGEVENLDLLGELNEGFLVGEINCGDTLLIAGPQGIQGPAGSAIFTEDGAPSNSLGLNGDFYLNNLTGDYYKKISGSWESEGNLRGPAGAQGANGTNGSNGTNGTNGVAGANGADGAQGLSAYQVWLAQGNVGNETVFLASLIGADGADGSDGANGLSAYQVWLAQGNTGNESVYLASLKGEQGISGATAIDDAIVDGVFNRAPSQNIVFGAIFAIYNAIADRLSRLGGTMDGPIDMVGDLLGTGHIILRPQDNSPSAPSSGVAVFADTDERLSWKSQNGYDSSFDVSAQSDNRVYELPDYSGPLMVDPMVAIGDLMYRDPSNITARIGIGSEDSILRVVGGIPQWEEENLTQDFGDKSDGNLTVSGALTLTQIPYYNVLTIGAGALLNTNGFPIYCRVLDLSNAPAGSIFRNGNNGVNSVTNLGGAGGSALTANILGGSTAGSGGGAGSNNAGIASGAPAGTTPSNGGFGGNSGASGAGGTGAGVVAGSGGTATNSTHLGRFEYAFSRGVTLILGGSGGDGGNSGGGDGSNITRGGGGGGGGAGVVVIYCAEIITSVSTPANVIQARGGNGGASANPLGGNVGGAGGAGGGGGGFIYLAYVKKTGPVVSGLLNASGGNGGNGGNALGTGVGGNGGSSGAGGIIQTYNVTTGLGKQIVGGPSVAGTVGVGNTGGTGANGSNCVASL